MAMYRRASPGCIPRRTSTEGLSALRGQFYGVGVPFPLNILLWPLDLAEYTLKWQVSVSDTGAMDSPCGPSAMQAVRSNPL